ncbi:hypothetical protein EDB83DRAFT_2407261 [Lactarius deliciosus]|nr:hypothetical protein EDB83DRAFT_2407261 [Lactarius deliciosus]
MAALKHSDRVISISLTVTSSLVEKMDTIAEPFSELEDLVLLSQNTIGAALPSTFKWTSRLRSLHSIRIAFPALPELLSFSKNLVYLQLHEIPIVGYFSPEAFANALSGMTQLRSLSLHFLSLPSRRNDIDIPPPSRDRVVLPVLECFKYRGTNKYLDSLVARIDAPCLEDIDITFFNQPTFNVSQLGRFIDRIEIQKLHGYAGILISNHAISICFTRPGTPARLRLQISCEQPLSSMGQICDHFPVFFSCIGDLRINATSPSSGQNDMDNGQWLHLIRSFRGAERFSVAGKLGTAIMRTLLPADGDPAIVLPLLRNLYVEEPGPLHAPLRAAVVSFITSRRLSGRPVAVEYTQPIISPPNFTAEDETPWERAERPSGGPVKFEHMQPMDPLNPTADDETTPWGSPRHLEVAPPGSRPGFIDNYACYSDIRRAFNELTDDNQPRVNLFGPIPFLSEHASLLNVIWAEMGI